MATSHSNRLSSLISLTRNPSTGSSCSDLYSMARARTAELLGVVMGAVVAEDAVATMEPDPSPDPEPAIIVEDACCDVEAAVVICSLLSNCSVRRFLSIKNISERNK